MPIILALHSVGSAVLNMLGSRVGQILLAAALAWGWGAHRANQRWEAQIAAERAAYLAAYRAEVARQEAAAENIAREATDRLAAEQASAADMQRQIAQLEKAESNAPDPRVIVVKGRQTPVCRSCAVDGDFARRMRELDAIAGARPASRRPH